MIKIILASTSPRRKLLLSHIVKDFEILSPDSEESIVDKNFSYELIESVAIKKGDSVRKKLKNNAIIISADTVVILDNIVLGKPKDFDEAFKMLNSLNGKTHKVVTSVYVINTDTNKKIIKSETSKVTFNNVTQEEIIKYINEYKPYDKAGSYSIQELGDNFVKEIKGDFDNIVGLPVNTLQKILEEIQE